MSQTSFVTFAGALAVVQLAAACLDHDLDACAPPVLTLGPIVGGGSDASAKMWARSDRAAAMTVEYWPSARPDDVVTSQAVELGRASDFTGAVTLGGLDPRTAYGYRVRLAPGEGCAEPVDSVAAESAFTTLPGRDDPASIRFLVAADVGGPDVPAFRQMLDLRPDFVLMTGDNAYADGGERTLEGYRAEYRRVWRGAQFRELFSQVPVFMTWDDHEIVNDYWRGKNDDAYAVARQAFDEYQGSHNPDPVHEDELYYTLAAGQVEVFVLDTRTHRSRNKSPDVAGKSMLGDEQKAALLDWLASSIARVKVIVSSVSFTRFATTGNDSWHGFEVERGELFAFAREHAAGAVVLITGDQHWSGVFHYEIGGAAEAPYSLYEFMPTPLAFDIGFAPGDSTPEILARDDDHMVFGVVDIDTGADPVQIDFTLCAVGEPCTPGAHAPPATAFDADGDEETVPFTLRLSMEDFGFGG